MENIRLIRDRILIGHEHTIPPMGHMPGIIRRMEAAPSGAAAGARVSCPLTEGPMVRKIAPGSPAWDEFGVPGRLAGMDFLERLIIEGRASLMHSGVPASGVDDKARAAGIPPESVIKAVCARERYCGDMFVIAASGPRKIRMSGLLPEDYDGCSLEIAPDLPPGMMHGTCTPFMPHGAAESVRYIVVESPEGRRRGRKGRQFGRLGDIEADISIGGTDPLARHLSVRMAYSEMVDALAGWYGPKLHIVPGIERM